MAQVAGPTLLAILPDWSWTLSLIFAGCCSNAYYLEQATRIQPACGTLMTFLHFLFTTVQALPSQLVWGQESPAARCETEKSAAKASSSPPSPSRAKAPHTPAWLPRLRKPSIPLARWGVQVVLYFGTSILNNSAFSFHVPVPVHIIFRSGGLVVNMVVGYVVKGRRYSPLQIASVLLVTGGVIASTLATTPAEVDNSGAGGKSSTTGLSPTAEYFCGVSMLTMALFLSACMGLYQESTFAEYGSEHWQEGLFYNHFLSLPLFVLRYGTLASEWKLAMNGPRMWVGWGSPSLGDHMKALRLGIKGATSGDIAGGGSARLETLLSPKAIWDVSQLLRVLPAALRSSASSYVRGAMSKSSVSATLSSSPGPGVVVPALFPALGLNVLTQLLCINGVNRLTAMCSSLTVTLVLVVRKAVSLAISVLVIAPAQGEEVQGIAMLSAGASAVLFGTLGYAIGSAQQQQQQRRQQRQQRQQKHEGETADGDTQDKPRPASPSPSGVGASSAVKGNADLRVRARKW